MMLEVAGPRFQGVNKIFKWTLRVLTLDKVDSEGWTIHDVRNVRGSVETVMQEQATRKLPLSNAWMLARYLMDKIRYLS